MRSSSSSRRPARGPAVSLHEAALRLLARRAYSRRELATRLESRGHPAAAVRAELDALTASGLLDDGRLADAVCRSQLERGRGRRAASVELQRRGLGRDARAAALQTIEPGDEAAALARALDVATSRNPAWARLWQVRRKVIRYLLARGFDPGQVRSALAEKARAAKEECDAAQPDDCHDP